MTFKQNIHNHFLTLINDKINLLQNVLTDLKESGANETKSSAGDKHETALAMLQIEQANKRTQLAEMMEQKNALQKINPAIIADTILNGSLIKTNKGYFYLSTSLGKISVEEILVMAISPQSPLGKKLIGLKVGSKAEINNNLYLIEAVL